MKDWFVEGLNAAAARMLTWAVVIMATLVVGFCAGYWAGHREITSAKKTLVAFVELPLLWMGNAEMFIAYAVTAVAWYLPPHYESRWLRVSSAIANLLVWFFVVYAVVVKTADNKLFGY